MIKHRNKYENYKIMFTIALAYAPVIIPVGFGVAIYKYFKGELY